MCHAHKWCPNPTCHASKILVVFYKRPYSQIPAKTDLEIKLKYQNRKTSK
jgi:hypothetical protein